MKTWHVEMIVALTLLLAVAYVKVTFLGNGYVEFLGAFAVIASFCHMQIADRLQERMAVQKKPDVECHSLLKTYLITKEALWIAFFLANGVFTALVGCFLFLLYPTWRRWWRKRHPIQKPARVGTCSEVEDFIQRHGYANITFSSEFTIGKNWTAEFKPRQDHPSHLRYTAWSFSAVTIDEAIRRAMVITQQRLEEFQANTVSQ